VDDLWATKSEDVGLIFAQLVSKIFNLVVIIHQHHRQTDGQTTCDSKTALCTVLHRGKKTERWEAGVVMCRVKLQICIMAQLMPLPITVSCSSKSRLVLLSWFHLSGAATHLGRPGQNIRGP